MKPKLILTAGGAGVGKGYFLSQLGNKINGYFIPEGTKCKFNYMNVDDIIEKNKEIPLPTANKMFNEVLGKRVQEKENIVLDTTSSNPKILNKFPNYDKFMIMIYAHPVISLLQNYNRERKVPYKSLLKNWEKVYSLIDEYKRILGDNFSLIINNNPKYQKEIEEFNNSIEEGKLYEYIQDLMKDFKSTYSKEFHFTEKEHENFFDYLHLDIDDEKEIKFIKKYIEKYYKDKQKYPDITLIKDKLKSYIQKQIEEEKKFKQLINIIGEKIKKGFIENKDNINSLEEVKQKIKKFCI